MSWRINITQYENDTYQIYLRVETCFNSVCKMDVNAKKNKIIDTFLDNELRFVTFGSGGNVIQTAISLQPELGLEWSTQQ